MGLPPKASLLFPLLGPPFTQNTPSRFGSLVSSIPGQEKSPVGVGGRV